MTGEREEAEVGALMRDLASAGPEGVVAAFARPNAPHGPLMKALLAAGLDGPVAAVFAAVWAEIPADLGPGRLNLLRWYLSGDAATALPERRAAWQVILARLLALNPFPRGAAWGELGFVAARLAQERGGAPGLRGAGAGLLARMEWDSLPLSAPMVLAAIHSVDLALVRHCLQRWPAEDMPSDLRRALDWAMGLVIEFAGIGPWLETGIEALFRRAPLDPLFAQRKVQVGLHRGGGFAALAAPLLQMRHDAADPNLKGVLQFGLWQAQAIGDARLEAHFSAALQALEPERASSPAPAASPQPQPKPGSPEAVVRAAQDLAGSDLWLEGTWRPDTLAEAWQAVAKAAALSATPEGQGLAPFLRAAQTLVQIDRREFSWITHFVAAPHAMGAPRFGLVDLRLVPIMHEGLMAVIAALCGNALDRFLADDPPCDLGLVARLQQLHLRASLEIDQPAPVRAMAARLAGMGILRDILALTEDALALHEGLSPGSAVPSREGSGLHRFLPRAGWSHAEAADWTPLAQDAPVDGAFGVLWSDGRLEAAPHATPPGQIALARIPGLALQSEDFLIGPAGTVLRPDPYHTSAEFPWPNAFMVAAGKRGIRLRPGARRQESGPVLVLEAFEALRWRNYYHWMVPILTRVALALEHGLLRDRRLVVPEGLSGWMTETLRLLGLGPDRLLVVPLGEERRFADALVMSSVEHVSPAGVAALRRRLLGPDPAPARKDGPALFLSRKGQRARRMANEEAVEEMAASMGFQVVAPQDLGIAGQIALFAKARGVAAVEGAALTNTLFAPPGLRVLAMCCQNDMMPIFNDLSIVLGQHHRKLAGRGEDVALGGNRFQPPFAVDIDLARASLQWVLDGPGKETTA